ncbi:uncharacterized protein LOC125682580 [Ostrea edulis]|uniref:uncharacterized protein LOC125682580 n=1 Tax=Ostrea edulis TaxID=37623 RepID=UPI00209433DC|nr:uncharacterized protein LOC125682580 [Ostrea edulis]
MQIKKGPLELCLIITCLLIMSGIVSAEGCDLTSVHKCFSDMNMAVLSENQTAFCNGELGKLSRCLQPYDTACQNDSVYQLNVQAFQPSTFGCQGNGSLQCDIQAIRSCSSELDISALVSNLTLFCNVELKGALECVGNYRDICSTSQYSDLYSSIVSSLQPEQYGCSGTSGTQCELFTATKCILDFNIQRLEHFNSTGSWMNETALCQHLKTAENCIAPYDSACGTKPSFSSIKQFLKDDRCKEPVTDPTSSSTRLECAVTIIVWCLISLLQYEYHIS